MGAYLSEPITDKDSMDKCSDLLSCGASSMQGWRKAQEDTFNVILDFDKDTAMFAVYDGHGGAEVAVYCAENFSDFIKATKGYGEGNLQQALHDAFLAIDETFADKDFVQEKSTPSSKDDSVKETRNYSEIMTSLQTSARMDNDSKEIVELLSINQNKDESSLGVDGNQNLGEPSGCDNTSNVPVAEKKKSITKDKSPDDAKNEKKVQSAVTPVLEEESSTSSGVANESSESNSNESNKKDDDVSSKIPREDSVISGLILDPELKIEDEFGEETKGYLSSKKGRPGIDSGSTATIALLRNGVLHVANAGDSRCVLCRDGRAIDMTIDHKPTEPAERKRIREAGGEVTAEDRINGGLNLSRAIGDHSYKQDASLPSEKQLVIAVPDLRQMVLTKEDEFLVIACDGIFNFLMSQDTVDFLRSRWKTGKKLSLILENLLDHCLAPDTNGDGTGCDNMTVVMVDLTKYVVRNWNDVTDVNCNK